MSSYLKSTTGSRYTMAKTQWQNTFICQRKRVKCLRLEGTGSEKMCFFDFSKSNKLALLLLHPVLHPGLKSVQDPFLLVVLGVSFCHYPQAAKGIATQCGPCVCSALPAETCSAGESDV